VSKVLCLFKDKKKKILRQDLNYIAQAGLELSILLPQPPQYWDYRRAPPPRPPFTVKKN
jgi:hypothetical protein